MCNQNRSIAGDPSAMLLLGFLDASDSRAYSGQRPGSFMPRSSMRSCSVDGGLDYLRRGFTRSRDDFMDLSVFEDGEMIG